MAADTYTYDALSTQPPGFRLLKLLQGDKLAIECELIRETIPASSLTAIPYEALSYAWGDTELTNPIRVNGKTVWIAENLYAALQCLRYPGEDRVLWSDAICINQSDKEERSRQVFKMGSIFSFATQVIFWLGKPTIEVALLMTALNDPSVQRLSRSQKGAKDHVGTLEDLWPKGLQASKDVNWLAKLRKGLETLLKRPWFERIWILQEVMSAQTAVVCAGTFSVSADVFATSPPLLGVTPSGHVQAVIDLMPRPWNSDDTRRDRERHSLYDLLVKFQASKATDKRDMIIALLGMSSEPLDNALLRPDYTISFAKVLQNTISYWFENTTMTIHQALQFLVDFPDTDIHATYIILPGNSRSKTERIDWPFGRLDGTRNIWGHAFPRLCIKDAALLFLEYCEGGLPGAGLIQAIIGEAGCTAKFLEVIPWYPDRIQRRVNVLIIKSAADAFEWFASLGYMQVANLVADRSIGGREKLLYKGLKLSLERRNWDVALDLLETGIDVSVQAEISEQFLCTLSRKDPEEAVVKLLLERVTNLNDHEGKFCTALSRALKAESFTTARLLLDKGARPPPIEEIENPHARDSLMRWGSEYNDIDLVQHLLDAGADADAGMVTASSCGHVDMVQLLLNHGANVNDKGSRRSALQLASSCGHVEIVQLLLNHGANVNNKGSWESALQLASEKGHKRVVQLLLNHGAAEHEDIVEQLLDIGAEWPLEPS